MYVIIWEYRVKAERIVEFEKIYHPGGRWAELFKKGAGFLGTELLRDPQHQERYMTIDRWMRSGDFESFLSQQKKEYETLDAQCDNLFERETLFGKWETIDPETR